MITLDEYMMRSERATNTHCVRQWWQVKSQSDNCTSGLRALICYFGLAMTGCTVHDMAGAMGMGHTSVERIRGQASRALEKYPTFVKPTIEAIVGCTVDALPELNRQCATKPVYDGPLLDTDAGVIAYPDGRKVRAPHVIELRKLYEFKGAGRWVKLIPHEAMVAA